jgi:hypothetical protein
MSPAAARRRSLLELLDCAEPDPQTQERIRVRVLLRVVGGADEAPLQPERPASVLFRGLRRRKLAWHRR